MGCFVVVGTNAACIGGFGALPASCARLITATAGGVYRDLSAPNPRASCTQNKSSTARASSRAPPRSWCSPNSSRTRACGFAWAPSSSSRRLESGRAFAAFNSQCTPTAIHSPVFPPDESCDGIESARDRNHPRVAARLVSSRVGSKPRIERSRTRRRASTESFALARAWTRHTSRHASTHRRARDGARARDARARDVARGDFGPAIDLDARAHLDARATFRASRTTSKAFVDASRRARAYVVGQMVHRDTPEDNSTQTWAFAESAKPKVDAILARYPSNYKRSAMIPLLDLAQQQNDGHLTLATMNHVAEILEVAPIRVRGGDVLFNV